MVTTAPAPSHRNYAAFLGTLDEKRPPERTLFQQDRIRTLSAEYFYNGRGVSDVASYDFGALFAGRIQSLAQNYAGLYAGYEITPLLKWNNYVVVNLNDHSHYFSPNIVYSVRENLDWTVGIQSFGGSGGSEYGRMPNLYYTQLQWFF